MITEEHAHKADKEHEKHEHHFGHSHESKAHDSHKEHKESHSHPEHKEHTSHEHKEHHSHHSHKEHHSGAHHSHDSHSHHKPKKKLRVKKKTIIYSIIVIALIVLLVFSIQKNISQRDQLTSSAAPSTAGSAEDKLLVKVNGESIYQSEIDAIYDSMPAQTKMLIKKEDVLNSTINEKLILQEAEKAGVTVSQEELDQAIEELAQMYGITVEEFFSGLSEQNVTKEYVMGFYTTRLTIAKYLNQTLFTDLEISDQEIEEYYNNNSQMFEQPESIEVSHILVNASDEAESILAELQDGGNFSELAIEHSTCPSSARGGNLGYAVRGQFVPEFEEAAFDLEIGELSDVVETQFGFHIITVSDKKEASTVSLEDSEEMIRSSLMQEKQGGLIVDYMDDLRNKSTIDFFE